MAAPPSPHSCRHRRQIGEDHQRGRQADLVGGVATDVEQRGEDLGSRFAGEEQATTVELGQVHQLDLHPGDDADVAAASAQGPEQVRVLVGGDHPQPAIGGDHVEPAHVVGGESPPPSQDPEPAAQGVGHGTDVRGGAGQRREAEGRGLVERTGPDRPGLEPGGPVCGVDPDRVGTACGDQQSVVGGHGDAVTSGLRPDRETRISRVADRGDHVGRAGRPHDDRRALVHGQIETGELPGIVLVPGP